MKLASLDAIFRALNDAGVRYVVAGGLAVNAHGYLRFTKDVDLVLDLMSDNVKRALAALGAIGYRPALPVDASGFADTVQREQWIRGKDATPYQRERTAAAPSILLRPNTGTKHIRQAPSR